MRRPLASATIVAAVLAAFLLVGAPAYGQAFCGPRDSVLTRLYLNYQEQPVAIGLSATGSIIEILVSDEGTWTVIRTSPNGITCVVTSGAHWRSVEQQAPSQRS